jgi:hypothetical protein
VVIDVLWTGSQTTIDTARAQAVLSLLTDS